MSNEEDNNKFECPVCFNKFNQSLIENHVNKCLFLNESTSSTREQCITPKRSLSFSKIDNESSFVQKKVKLSSPISSNNNDSNNLQRESSSSKTKKKIDETNAVPLAEKMRPDCINSYVGQIHAIGEQSILYKLLNNSEVLNVILWGPPGCGKTSLAHVIENICKQSSEKKYRFVKLSAAISGVKDVKDLITTAFNDLNYKRRTVLFLDEIHRFNKTQQDILLPHIESGTITLIGATTENPSYTLNSALLSRCRVIVLEKLSIENLIVILNHAVNNLQGLVIEDIKDQSFCAKKNSFFIDSKAIDWLAETSDGDARIALGGLELAVQYKCRKNNESQVNVVTLDDIKNNLKKSHMLYDKRGDQHYDLISALHKSIRASDVDASLYWLSRMLLSGEDPVYISRRIVRAASEDIGLEDPKALGLAVNTMQACKLLGMPDCDVVLARCVTYLAEAPKSRLMDNATKAAQKFVSSYKDVQPSVPLHLRNKPDSDINDNNEATSYFPNQVLSVDFFSKV